MTLGPVMGGVSTGLAVDVLGEEQTSLSSPSSSSNLLRRTAPSLGEVSSGELESSDSSSSAGQRAVSRIQ